MQPLMLVYFTDPWCAWCWASEPHILRLREEYGKQLKIIYRMGGLLEDISKFYGSGKIPYADIANHFRAVSRHSGMPIDEETTLKDPPQSTWPSNIAFKAAELQSEALAERLLRRMREAAFIEGRNIAKKEVLEELANEAGLDLAKYKEVMDSGKAEIAFREDLRESEDRKIKGFPTLIFKNSEGQEISLVGYRKYEEYESAIDRLTAGGFTKMSTSSLEDFVKKYNRVTTVEVAEVFQFLPSEALTVLTVLEKKGVVKKISLRIGTIWESLTTS